MNYAQIHPQIVFLQSKGYKITLDDLLRWIILEGSSLPRFGSWSNAEGRQITHTSILFDIPKEFPMVAPGVGFGHPSYAIHVPKLYFNGRQLSDTHHCSHSPWTWLCFQEMKWNPRSDNLVTLLEAIEYSIIKRAKKT